MYTFIIIRPESRQNEVFEKKLILYLIFQMTCNNELKIKVKMISEQMKKTCTNLSNNKHKSFILICWHHYWLHIHIVTNLCVIYC